MKGFTPTPERVQPASGGQRAESSPRLVSGFTIIELATVILIIGILVAMGIPGLTTNIADPFVIRGEAQRLAQEIRLVQEMGISSTEMISPDPSKAYLFVPQGGYGIRIETAPTNIFTFLDCDDDHDYTLGGTICSIQPVPPSDDFAESVLGKTIVLDERIQLEDILVDGFSVANASIVFRPPQPTVYLNAGSGTNNIVIVLSAVNNTTRKERIIINTAGLIEVE